ncbi:carbohydrate ABC transporter permease [Bifidobacterium phasiani]|uniref:Carbohydrate ABC transporter permease n=1 Tax=Bifidobacterium phasiani TaxID=2834431 RepID=A0ABS6WAH0_9BIFI|nr:carbohydrate ABC transporter permease [Bifidobacterium phasiani]MBW3083508.1 carbohydrate ABC transporter permease [Bifidobacterium phasiani]
MAHRSTWWKTLIGVVLTLIMLFPVYWMVNIAFTERSAIRSGDLYPKAFTLENFQRVFTDQMPYLGTSLVVALSCVLVTLVIALPAAYAIAILRLGGARTVNFLLVVAQMIPAVVMALGFYQIFTALGLLDTIPGLILADSTIAVPFAVMLLTSFMSGMPSSLIEAARIDGASNWCIFARIVVPLSRNAVVTTSLFAFLWAWSDFMFASTLDAGGGRLRPITMGIYDYIGAQNQEWGPLMATAVVASIPTALLLIVAQRYVAAGVTAGAIKD